MRRRYPDPDVDVVRRTQSADPTADETVPWPEPPTQTDRIADIVHSHAAELSVAIRAKVVSCEKVMTAYLDHIEALNPAVNAIVSLCPRAELPTEAREKDALLREGTYEGWIHGFPHAVKDLADVRGIHTSHGLLPPSADSPLPARDARRRDARNVVWHARGQACARAFASGWLVATNLTSRCGGSGRRLQ